jgi:hypothetical protein
MTWAECVGGRCTIIWGRKLSNEKIAKKNYIVALDACRTIFDTQQSTKNMRIQPRRNRRGCGSGNGWIIFLGETPNLDQRKLLLVQYI